MLQPNGKWHELQSNDVIFEDIKEYKFIQARIAKPATLAVVTRARKETFNVQRKGAKVIPSVDGRICVTFKPAMYKNTTQVTLEVCINWCNCWIRVYFYITANPAHLNNTGGAPSSIWATINTAYVYISLLVACVVLNTWPMLFSRNKQPRQVRQQIKS